MEEESKVRSPDDYDKYISAEIPDQKKYPKLHRLVCTHMMHGPCGVLNRKCACMVDGSCCFHYPRDFSETTQQGKDSYPIYRRDDGKQVKIRGEWLNNRWVCCSIKSVKYLYKYVFHFCWIGQMWMGNQL